MDIQAVRVTRDLWDILVPQEAKVLWELLVTVAVVVKKATKVRWDCLV